MPKRRFTDEEERQIARVYRETMRSFSDLSEQYGCCPNTIGSAIKRQEQEAHSRGPRFGFKYHHNYRAFDNIDTEATAYWLGFLFGDGHVSQQGVVHVHLKRGDIQHLESFRDFLSPEVPIAKVADNKGYEKCTLAICSKAIASRLIELGITAGRARANSFSVIDNVPKDLERHFVRGFFDADGAVHGSRPMIIFCGNTASMIFVREIMADNGFGSYDKKIVKHSVSDVVHYLYYGGKPQVGRMADWLYHDATIWLPRKRERICRVTSDMVSRS